MVDPQLESWRLMPTSVCELSFDKHGMAYVEVCFILTLVYARAGDGAPHTGVPRSGHCLIRRHQKDHQR